MLCPTTLCVGCSRARWGVDPAPIQNIPYHQISSKMVRDYWAFDTYTVTLAYLRLFKVIKFLTIGAAFFECLHAIYQYGW